MSSTLTWLAVLWYAIGLLGSSISLQKIHRGKGQTDATGIGVYIFGMFVALWGVFNLFMAVFLITPDRRLK